MGRRWGATFWKPEGACSNATSSLRLPLPLRLLFSLFSPVAFTRPVNAFHSLGYFHTSFVSRYSSILHSGTLHYRIHDFRRGNILGYEPWPKAVARFAPLPQSRQGKTTRSASTSALASARHLPICTTTTAHTRDYLPPATCSSHSPICPSDALAACAFISPSIHT